MASWTGGWRGVGHTPRQWASVSRHLKDSPIARYVFSLKQQEEFLQEQRELLQQQGKLLQQQRGLQQQRQQREVLQRGLQQQQQQRELLLHRRPQQQQQRERLQQQQQQQGDHLQQQQRCWVVAHQRELCRGLAVGRAEGSLYLLKCGARGFATGMAKGSGAPLTLSKNVEMREMLSPRWVLEPPNFLRRPLWRQWWEAQFANRSFFFFGNAWTSAAAFAAFLWWSRIFDPPPKERLDRYWLNSPKFRILSAFHNPGKRPGLKISLMTYEARYCYRGLDHPFTINELKDFLFKLREQHLVNYFQGVQFPFVFRQYNRVQTPATLEVQTSPVPQQLPHFHENHGDGGHH